MNISETKREKIAQWAATVTGTDFLSTRESNDPELPDQHKTLDSSLESRVSENGADSFESQGSLILRSELLRISEEVDGNAADCHVNGRLSGLASEPHNIGFILTGNANENPEVAPNHLSTKNLSDSSEANYSLGLGSDMPEIKSSSEEDNQPVLAVNYSPSGVHELPNFNDTNSINESLGLGSDLPEIECSSDDSLGLSSDLPEIESSSEKTGGSFVAKDSMDFVQDALADVNDELDDVGYRRVQEISESGSSHQGFTASISSKALSKSTSSFHPDSVGRCIETSPPPDSDQEKLTSPHILEKAALLGDPWFWGGAWQGLRSMNKELDICFEAIDLYLLSSWHDLREDSLGNVPSCYYIDERTARQISRNIQTGLKERLLLRTENPLEKFPVLTTLRESKTSYGTPTFILLNYDLNQIIVLGRSQVEEHEEIHFVPEWMDNLWTSIGTSFEWAPTRRPRMFLMNWIPRQNFATSVASLFDLIASQKWIWEKGMYHVATRPAIQCSHSTRQRIFAKVLPKCTQYAQYWKMLRGSQNDWISPQQDLLADLEIGFTNFSWVQHSSIRLLNAMRVCSLCCPDDLMAVKEAGRKHSSSSSEPSEDVPQRPYKQRNTRTQSKDLAIPSEESAAPEDSNLAGSLNFYDDYSSAPLETREPDRIPGIWTFQNGQSILPSCWITWKDRGHRLRKHFFNTIPVRAPATHHDRFLPFVDSGAKSDTDENMVEERAHDSITLSAQQMLDEAGMTPGTHASLRVFVKGVERMNGGSEKYIKVDLTGDEVSIPADQVDVSVDLDSMMWITDADSFRIKSLELRQTPSTSQKPAFSVNNFVYVNLVCPPKTQGELINAEERTRANFKLSRIPHMELGHCGEGDRRVNFYVFFPRMIKQDFDTGRYSTLVPRTVQELWLDKVILSSCQQVFEEGVGFSEYLSSTVKTIQDRSGNRRKQKSMTIYGTNTERLVQKMSTNVKESPDLLGCFGSFFFVADARGMKLATKQCIEGNLQNAQSYITDFDAIKLQFGDLYWDHMLDRDKGELYLDIGVSFHPRHTEPVVGLWRLPKLRESYDLMDMKTGTVHHFNTFGAYGGLKSESKNRMRQVSQLVSRLSYCLVFEMVRNPGTEEYLCSDKDIAECGPKFISACKRWTDIFEIGEHRSFGVREEIRGIGATIIDILGISLEKARSYLSSGPIIWIHSSTFFKFLARRLTEVRNLQVSCYKMRVPNYCLLSLINGFLLRHVMVTPFMKNRYLLEALRELRSREIMATFGALFLHNLDISTLMLSDISQEDTDEMRKLLGDPIARSSKKRQSEHPPPLALTLERKAVEYPWGEYVTVIRLKDLLETIAVEFLKVSRPDDLNLTSPHSEKLFVAFSQQIWLSLSGQAIGEYPPSPQTLEDALKVWTITELKKHCNSIELLPCLFGLDGVQSRAAASQISFRDRRSIFFPSPIDYNNYSSHWQPFKNHETGYISMYHNILKHSSQENKEYLNVDLDNIFSRLQCLPPSSGDLKKGSIWTSHRGRVQFITNPRCYPIKGIGKETEKVHQATRRFQLSSAVVNKLFHEKIYGTGSYKYQRNRKGKKHVKRRKKVIPRIKKTLKGRQEAFVKKNDVSDTEIDSDSQSDGRSHDSELSKSSASG